MCAEGQSDTALARHRDPVRPHHVALDRAGAANSRNCDMAPFTQKVRVGAGIRGRVGVVTGRCSMCHSPEPFYEGIHGHRRRASCSTSRQHRRACPRDLSAGRAQPRAMPPPMSPASSRPSARQSSIGTATQSRAEGPRSNSRKRPPPDAGVGRPQGSDLRPIETGLARRTGLCQRRGNRRSSGRRGGMVNAGSQTPFRQVSVSSPTARADREPKRAHVNAIDVAIRPDTGALSS